MAQQTAVEWLMQEYKNNPYDCMITLGIFEQALQMERLQIRYAVMYGLDEDGHTGEWKIRFAKNYYINCYETSKQSI